MTDASTIGLGKTLLQSHGITWSIAEC